MKKFRALKIAICAAAAVLAALLFAVFLFPYFVTGSGTGSEDDRCWMGKIDDSVPISEISIPGTHDTSAVYVPLALFVKCQSLTIAKQLDAGYRYLDIRVDIDDDGKLVNVHSFVKCLSGFMPWSGTLSFRESAKTCISFLEENPTETIIMVIKNENDASDADVESALNDIFSENPDRWLLTDTIPTLGECRGKIVVLRRYSDDENLGSESGIDVYWRDQGGDYAEEDAHLAVNEKEGYSVAVQDRYNYSAEEKWTAITNAFKETDEYYGNNMICINFTSSTGGISPGMPLSCAFSINAKLRNADLSEYKFVGWVITDFGGSEIAEKIYRVNFN